MSKGDLDQACRPAMQLVPAPCALSAAPSFVGPSRDPGENFDAPTPQTMHVEVRTLSPAVQDALRSVGYGARDIRVVATDHVEAYASAGDGQRGFVVIVNLDTGERALVRGDWGGMNPFGQASPVDIGDENMRIPSNGVVIKGSTGYPRTFATIYTTALGRFLPSGEPDETTDAEQQVLYCFTAIKGGEYRRQEMRRRGVTPETVDALVERGYLSRNKAGAIQATTKGKNARDRTRVGH